MISNPSLFSAIKKLNSLLEPAQRWQCARMVGFSMCSALLEVITASVIVIFVQVLNQPESGHKYFSKVGFKDTLSFSQMVLYAAIVCGVIYFIKNLLAAAEVFYQNFSIQKMNFHFKNKLLYRYAQADYGFYLTRNSSLGLSVVGSDVEQVFSTGMIALANIISESVVFFALIGMIIFMDPSLALVIACVAMVLALIVAKGLMPLFYGLGQKFQVAALDGQQHLSQFFHAFKEIVLLGKRQAFIDAYQDHAKKKSHVQAIQHTINALPRIVIEILFVGCFVATVAYLCFSKENSMQMMGILGGYLYLGFRLMPGINRIISQLNNLKYVMPGIERVYEEYHTVAQQENTIDVPDFHFDKTIVLKDLSFSYINTSRDVLLNINLEIKKGECLGIVGETGSGKSTLVDIILGLLRPNQGSIKIDNQYPVNSHQWHAKIAYVPQAIYLMDDTIEANVAFGENIEAINEAQLNKAIQDAQLNTLVEHLPLGLKTIVGERGIRLSGGERQRIAIARALYRNPEVLIFDEATSALDTETEVRLMETIQAVSVDRTVIMIAHRLTTLKDCNRIVVMEKGSIKEITQYDNLQKSVANHV